MGRILEALNDISGGELTITSFTVTEDLTVGGNADVTGNVTAATFVPAVVPEITGEFANDTDPTNAIVIALLAALDGLGLITDSTTVAA